MTSLVTSSPVFFGPNRSDLAIARPPKQQADKIRQADDPKKWWHDVKPRTWTVERPFYPGYVDSTHWFHVRYEIDGKEVDFWTVDTRKGTAKRSEPTDWGKEKR